MSENVFIIGAASGVNLGTAPGMEFLINANETGGTQTVTLAITNIVNYSLSANTYSLILMEADGFITCAVGSTKQVINILLRDGATTKNSIQLETSGANFPQVYPFMLKTSFSQTGAINLHVAENSAADDANTTVTVNNLRVYGVI